MMHRIAIFLTIFFLALPCSAGQNENNSIHINKFDTSYLGAIEDNEVVLSLDDLIKISLENSPLLEVARQKMIQSQGQLTQARSGYLPQIDLQGSSNYTQRKNSSSTQTAGSIYTTETEKDTIVLGVVSLSQLLYDFGRTTGAIDAGKSNLQAADANIQSQVQEVIFQVKSAYYSVLEKRRLIDVEAEAVKNLQQHVDRAKLYLKAGVRTKIDVINAKVELSNTNMNLLRANYSLKTARVILEQVLGKKPNSGRYTLSSDAVQLENIVSSVPPVPDTLDKLIDVALNQRPSILQLNKLSEAAQANLARVKGDYWPSITAEAKYSDYETELSDYKDSWEVGVVCTWNLFSGFHTEGSVVEANGRILENRAQLQDQRLAVAREVTESYLQAEEYWQSIQIAMETLKFAKENFLLAEKRYRSGTNDVLEFNDAQLTLTRTQSDLVAAYYGYLTALAGIDRSIGRVL